MQLHSQVDPDGSRPRHHPAGHRDRHAGRGGIAQRQALQRRAPPESRRPAPRWRRTTSPARPRLDGRRLQALAQHPQHGRGCGRRRRPRSSSSAPSAAAARSRAIAAAVKAVSVAAPSAGDIVVELQRRRNRCGRAISAAAAQRTACASARAIQAVIDRALRGRCGPRCRTAGSCARNM